MEEAKVYQVVIPDEPTIKDLAAILKLMTITLEVNAGDTVADQFVAENGHLVVDITVAHGQAQKIAEAFDETAKADLS